MTRATALRLVAKGVDTALRAQMGICAGLEIILFHREALVVQTRWARLALLARRTIATGAFVPLGWAGLPRMGRVATAATGAGRAVTAHMAVGA